VVVLRAGRLAAAWRPVTISRPCPERVLLFSGTRGRGDGDSRHIIQAEPAPFLTNRCPDPGADLLALDDALTRLAAEDAQAARVVGMRISLACPMGRLPPPSA
jgi:hypothetical protein